MGRRYEEREGEPATLGALPGSALLGALPGAAFLLTVARDIRERNDRAAPLVTDRDLTSLDGLARPDHRERVRVAEAIDATGTDEPLRRGVTDTDFAQQKEWNGPVPPD